MKKSVIFAAHFKTRFLTGGEVKNVPIGADRFFWIAFGYKFLSMKCRKFQRNTRAGINAAVMRIYLLCISGHSYNLGERTT